MELRRRAGWHVPAKVVEQSLVGNGVEVLGSEKLSEAAMGLGVVVIEAVGAEFEIGRERAVPAEADGEDGGRRGVLRFPAQERLAEGLEFWRRRRGRQEPRPGERSRRDARRKPAGRQRRGAAARGPASRRDQGGRAPKAQDARPRTTTPPRRSTRRKPAGGSARRASLPTRRSRRSEAPAAPRGRKPLRSSRPPRGPR